VVFSHGHLLRVLGARWIELEPADGARLGLAPGGVSVLAYEHGDPILARWNDVREPSPQTPGARIPPREGADVLE
jgi:broad specificity phosphatase PhoE